MQGNYGANAFEFLISTLIDLFVMVVLLRFLMQTLRVDFYNPISQFTVKLTTPLLKPIRRFIPSIKSIDTSTLFLSWTLLSIKMTLLKLLESEMIRIGGVGIMLQLTSIGELLYFAIIALLVQIIDIFFFVIILQAILSWVNPNPYSPIHTLLRSLSYPILKPFRHWIPPIAGVDINPLFALITIQVVKMLLIPPLLGLA